MFADSEYLFRHAVLRDAAYQLQPPAERAALHAAVLALLPGMLGANAQNAAAAELANHARGAQEAPDADRSALGRQELSWLRRAAEFARDTFRLTEAAACYERIADHPLTTGPERVGALVSAAGIGIRAWPAAVVAAKLELALDAARHESLPEVEATALAYCAALHDLGGRIHEAEATFRRAIALHRSGGEGNSARNVSNQLATLLRDTGRRQESEVLFEELLGQVGEDIQQASTMTNYAGQLADTGQTARAEELYWQALRLFRAHKHRQGEGSLLGNIGNLMLNQGRLAEAEAYIVQALEIHRETGNKRSLGISLGNLARMCHDAGGRELEAERLYIDALDIHRELGNQRSEALVLCNYGTLLLKLGELERADAALRKSVEFHRASHNSRLEGITLGSIAALELARGNEARARTQIAKAKELMARSGDERMAKLIAQQWAKDCAERGIEP